jgi:hypothetical protein
MSRHFFSRLAEYYEKVAEVLRGQAHSAAIFPNTTDIGMSRERIYADFLRWHAPTKCNVFFGGFLFSSTGDESDQLDVIVTADTNSRFDFHNRDGSGKSFSHTDGTLAVASIKSTLDKKELHSALRGLASIPPTGRLQLASPLIAIPNYDDWPYKIIYAPHGIACDTLLEHLNHYYAEHSYVPLNRRPNLIHVAGKRGRLG